MHRRLFNGIATATIGSNLLTSASAFADTEHGTRGVQLAIATICTDGFANQHHEPAMRYIPEFGYRNVELNLWFSDQITPDYIQQLSERCAKVGLTPISIQGTGFGVHDGRNGIIKDLSHKLMMMQYAKQLGCRIVKFTGARRGTQGGLEAVIDVCKDLAPAAKEMDILVTLENHTGNNLETIEDYDRIFSAIDSTFIGLCLDTGHFEGSGIRLSEVLDRLHERTYHVDLKDCRAFGKGHDTVPFGEGTTDFDAFLNQLMDTGYQGYLVIEQAWSEPQGNWKEDLTSAFHRFSKWCE